MLGTEPAQSMVDWLDGIDERRDGLRHDVEAQSAQTRAEMRVGFAAADARIEQRMTTLMK